MTKTAHDMNPFDVEELQKIWQESWEPAQQVWSSYTQLSSPRWCLNRDQAASYGIDDGLAMIRLQDHSVVINLVNIAARMLGGFALEILAHEIGHHVYVPADLGDNARLLARVRAGVPGYEQQAPMISNLYADLLINDRLQRFHDLDMAGIYEAMRTPEVTPMWAFYLHTYEHLWGLPDGTLFEEPMTERIRADAAFAARLIRNFSSDWLGGAGSYAVLCLDYLNKELEATEMIAGLWLDAAGAGAGDAVPDGLAECSSEEASSPVHPSMLEGSAGEDRSSKQSGSAGSARRTGEELVGGRKSIKRNPQEYLDLMKTLGVRVDEQELVIRYYRELARPHLIPYPVASRSPSMEDQIEGVQTWHPGQPLANIDWMETTMKSPHIVPGVTTVERIIGEAPGNEKKSRPADLYLGVDCSGSMTNPAYGISYPVVAGTVVISSALRAGAKAKTVLSGSPGRHDETEGYSQDLQENLRVLTGYLGTGYAFGLDRLDEEFLKKDPPEHPVHVLVITDGDIFHMLEEYKDGWEVAAKVVERAGGGVSCVLDLPDYGGTYRNHFDDRRRRLSNDVGWDVYLVSNEEELVTFAREFSQKKYGECRGGRS